MTSSTISLKMRLRASLRRLIGSKLGYFASTKEKHSPTIGRLDISFSVNKFARNPSSKS